MYLQSLRYIFDCCIWIDSKISGVPRPLLPIAAMLRRTRTYRFEPKNGCAVIYGSCLSPFTQYIIIRPIPLPLSRPLWSPSKQASKQGRKETIRHKSDNTSFVVLLLYVTTRLTLYGIHGTEKTETGPRRHTRWRTRESDLKMRC